MAQLYSQYASGTQFIAGAIVGNSVGVSGLNPIVDRLNSIAPSDNLVSGTSIVVQASGVFVDTTIPLNPLNAVANDITTLTWETQGEFVEANDTATLKIPFSPVNGATLGSVTLYLSGAQLTDYFIFAQNYSDQTRDTLGHVLTADQTVTFNCGGSIVDTGNNYYNLYLEEFQTGTKFYGGKIETSSQ